MVPKIGKQQIKVVQNRPTKQFIDVHDSVEKLHYNQQY